MAGYKINRQKSVVFLHVNNALTEREIKKTVPFIIASRRIKYLGINITKEVKNLYSKNYKTVKKEIEERTSLKNQRYKFIILLNYKIITNF